MRSAFDRCGECNTFVVFTRASQYDVEGMSDTWVGSFLGGDIPQIDGAADEDSDEEEDFKIPRRKRSKGKARNRSDRHDNASNMLDISTPREISQKIPSDSGTPERNVEQGGTEKSGESLSGDVWPQKAKAIRTYSKKGKSVLKSQRVRPFNEGRTAKKDKEEIVVDSEEEGEKEKCEDEFKLFLSESSDSEDNITQEGNLRSNRNEVAACQKSLSNISKRKTSNARKSNETQCTPVITKYFHSPEKNPEGQDSSSSSSVEQTSGSSQNIDKHFVTQVLPHCSKQREGYSRQSTLRKRKLLGLDQKEGMDSRRMSLRRRNQNTDLVASLSVVSGAMADLSVSLNDISRTPTLNSKFDEAQKRLRKRRENPRENFTVVNQRLTSPARKEKRSEKRSPLRSRKNETSPLSKKRSSPKRKDERVKKYGALPVLIAKSPKKNLVDNVVADAVSTSEGRQFQVEPSFHSSQISRDSRVSSNDIPNSGTGRASSRSRGRVSGLFSSRTIATASVGGNNEASRPVPFSSRGLSLKSAGSNRDTSRSDKGHTLSFQRKGLKRKFIVDTEKDMQSTPVKVLPGMGKKRKLSLTLKVDKSRPDLREEGVCETFITSTENRLTKESKSDCEEKKEISKTQQVGVSNENNDTILRSENKKEFALNTAQFDDIICIPSSPGDSDSNDDPLNGVGSSTTIAESKLIPVSSKTCSKSNDDPITCMSHESEREVPENAVNDLQLLSHCPNEKDTELLANALFNMSYPSPLPCGEECYSPPCPSSPLDAKHDTPDLRNQHNRLQENELLTINSSIVEEEGMDSDLVEPESKPVFSLSQDVHLPHLATSSLLQMRPQLGETQTQFESTSMEYSDANVSRQLESKSIENEDGTDCFDQIVGDREMAGDKKLIESRKIDIHNSNPKTSSILEGRKDSESNSELVILKDKSHGSNNDYGGEPNESVADITSCDSTTTRLLQTSMTDLPEAVEKISDKKREFALKLSTAEDSSTDGRPLVHSNLHICEIEMSVEKDNQDQQISSENIHEAIVLVSPTIPDDQSKSQICSTHVVQSLPNCTSLELNKNDCRLGRRNVIAIEPLRRPPSSEELLSSLKDYELPQCRYQEPFCSDPDDIPACPRLVTRLYAFWVVDLSWY